MRPWNNWYHVSGHTYGSWLPGDPRGWRTRHHRGHVEGDYKNPPPPGAFGDLLQRSARKLGRPPIVLSSQARRIACEIIVQALQFHQLEPLAVAVTARHYHILARFSDHNPRKWVGIAKTRSARALSESGHAPPGGVWAARNKVTPINNREHQTTAFRYILSHARKGAAIWRFSPVTKASRAVAR